MASERDEAIRLAHKVLDEPYRDPDDDLSVMSRQFLRAREIVEKQEKALQEVDWNGKAELDLIHANRDALLKMHEEAVRRIRKQFQEGSNGDINTSIALTIEILDALRFFHPMQGESWKGWPEGTE